MKPFQIKARVNNIEEVMPRFFHAWLEAPQIAAAARPGQFLMVRCGDEVLLRRPLSVHRVSKDKKQIALLFTVFGKGTKWLSEIKSGDFLDIIGPLGNSFNIKPGKKLLLMAGGYGIAPLVFLAEEAMKAGCRVDLVQGVRTGALASPKEMMPEGAELTVMTEDASLGLKGRITDCPDRLVAEADQIFACGPMPMYRALTKMDNLKGKDVQTSLEIMMACGVNLCYGCTIKTKKGLKQVCSDGPVFDLDDILWDEQAI